MKISIKADIREDQHQLWFGFVQSIAVDGRELESTTRVCYIEIKEGALGQIFGMRVQIPKNLLHAPEWVCWFNDDYNGASVFGINETPLAVNISGKVDPLPADLKEAASIVLSYVSTLKIPEILEHADPERLTSLHISYCEHPTDLELQPLMRFKRLTHLCIEESRLLNEPKSVTDLSLLIGLKQLQSLSLSGGICQMLKTIEPLSKLPELTALALLGCPADLDLNPLSEMPKLNELALSDCITSSNLSIISSLIQLDCLSLNVNESFKDLTPLAHLINLRSLLISGGSEIVDIGSLAALHKLEELHLFWCPSLKNLAPLAELRSLESLLLFKCTDCDVTPLAGLTHLRKLVLSGCGPVKGLNLLSGMKNLKDLHIVD